MGNELALAKQGVTGTLAVRTMDDLARLGNMLAQSGYFTDAREAAQAGVKVLAGLEMGIGAFSAMSGIHIIEGKPSVGAGLMAAAVKRSGKYDYRVTAHTDSECSIDFFENGLPCGTSSFSIADAKTAGLKFTSSSGKPTGWTKNPRNMLFARALSNGVRWYCPDVFDVSTYTPEELGAEVDDDGHVITAETVKPPEQVEQNAEQIEEQVEDVGILSIDAAAIATALKPLKLSKEAARELVASVVSRDVATITDLTREEGEMLAELTTDQWADALDLMRQPESV